MVFQGLLGSSDRILNKLCTMVFTFEKNVFRGTILTDRRYQGHELCSRLLLPKVAAVAQVHFRHEMGAHMQNVRPLPATYATFTTIEGVRREEFVFMCQKQFFMTPDDTIPNSFIHGEEHHHCHHCMNH